MQELLQQMVTSFGEASIESNESIKEAVANLKKANDELDDFQSSWWRQGKRWVKNKFKGSTPGITPVGE